MLTRLPRRAGRRDPSSTRTAAGVVGAVVLTGAALGGYADAVRLRTRAMVSMGDLGIYRAAATAVHHGRAVYGVRFPPLHMPFTYTPVAALLFVPLTWLSWDDLRLAVVIANVLAVFACAALSVRLASGALPWHRFVPTTLVLGAVCLWTEPVQQTLRFGQINLLLLALALVDLRLPDSSPVKGCLIGVAAVIKLTPAVLIAYLVVTGRRTAAARAIGVAVGAALVAAVVLPSASWGYWTHGVFATGQIGNPIYLGNQSIRGVLARLLGIGTTTTLLWLPLAATAVAGGLVWGRKLHRAGHDLAGATTVAVAGLLASPFSWSHHWVWIIPTLALAWEGAHRSPSLGRRVLPLLVAATFAAWWIARPGIPGGSPEGLLWLVPGKHSVERHWSLAQMLLGDLYVELAVAAACAAGLLGAVRSRANGRGAPRTEAL